MTDSPAPIVVNPSALPDIATVAVRYGAALLSGWLVRKGVITGDDEPLVLGLALALAAIGWAIYRAISMKRDLVTAARSAHDSVARVIEPPKPI